MDKIVIKKVVNPPKEVLETTTKWMYEWWGKESKYDYDSVYYYMLHSFNEERLPQTYAMFLDDKIIGLYQLTYRDLFTRPDIYPWIANVYIDEPYRGQGYGKILINGIKENVMSNTGFKEVFGYTHHKNLYEKYGWKLLFDVENSDERIYKLDIK